MDFSYTGLGKNNNGLWYVKGGQVDFSRNEKKSGWSIVNGQVKDSPDTTITYNMEPMVDNNSYSGRLFVGDSRVIQMYRYNDYQYYDQASFVTVGGGGYSGSSSSINSSERLSTMETCTRESIEYTGGCDVYIFATPNEFNDSSSSYTIPVQRVMSVAEQAKTWTASFNGKTVAPTVYVVELIAGKGVTVSGYNSYLRSMAADIGVQTISISDCLAGSNGGYSSGNLHFNTTTTGNIWSKLLS